jgi:hypothetical protein
MGRQKATVTEAKLLPWASGRDCSSEAWPDVSSCLPDKKHFKAMTKVVCNDARPLSEYQKNVHYPFQPLGEYPNILRNDLSPLSEGVKIIAHNFLSDFQRFFLSHLEFQPLNEW